MYTKEELIEFGKKYYQEQGDIPRAKKAGYCSRDWIYKKWLCWEDYIIDCGFEYFVHESTRVYKRKLDAPVVQLEGDTIFRKSAVLIQIQSGAPEKIDYTDLATQICEKLNKKPDDVIINSYKAKRKITYFEIIKSLLSTGSTTKTATELSVGYKTVFRATEKFNLPKLNGAKTFKYFLLQLINKKYCGICQQIKDLNQFGNNKSSSTGIEAACKDCKSIRFRKWYLKHSEEQNQRAIKRKRNLDREFSLEEINFIFERDNYKCKICGLEDIEHQIRYGQRLHIDHILPVNKGGLTTHNYYVGRVIHEKVIILPV